jgi:hypothetical protein
MLLLGRDFQVRMTVRGLAYRGPGGPLDCPDLGLGGRHQLGNAALALAAVSFAPVTLGDAERREALASVEWPGRLEVVREQPRVVLDVAHNPAAARALANALRDLLLGPPSPLSPGQGGVSGRGEEAQRVHLVIGALADKDADGISTGSPPSPRASCWLGRAPNAPATPPRWSTHPPWRASASARGRRGSCPI